MRCLFCGDGDIKQVKANLLNNCKRQIFTHNQDDRENENPLFAFLDSNPLVRGHTLIGPIGKEYHNDIWNYKIKDESQKKMLNEIIQAVQYICNQMRHNLFPTPKKIYITGLCESEDHFHLHLIPSRVLNAAILPNDHLAAWI